MTDDNPLKAHLMRKILIAELRSLGCLVPGPNGLGNLHIPSEEEWTRLQAERAKKRKPETK
jgi:hypothetical protein